MMPCSSNEALYLAHMPSSSSRIWLTAFILSALGVFALKLWLAFPTGVIFDERTTRAI